MPIHFYAPLLVSHIYITSEKSKLKEKLLRKPIPLLSSLYNKEFTYVMLNLILLLHTVKQLHLQDKNKRRFSSCDS